MVMSNGNTPPNEDYRPLYLDNVSVNVLTSALFKAVGNVFERYNLHDIVVGMILNHGEDVIYFSNIEPAEANSELLRQANLQIYGGVQIDVIPGEGGEGGSGGKGEGANGGRGGSEGGDVANGSSGSSNGDN